MMYYLKSLSFLFLARGAFRWDRWILLAAFFLVRIFCNIMCGPGSVVGSESDLRFRRREFDPYPVPYFCGD